MLIGDQPLTPAAVAAAARGGPQAVGLSAAARARIAEGHAAVLAAATRRPVYGHTTGVGANRHVAVEDDPDGHARRLLRSHTGGLGAPLPGEVVRATILIRLNQIAAGGGGHRVEVADALARLLAAEELPTLHDLGGLGTGDLTVLAELALALEPTSDKRGLTPFTSESTHKRGLTPFTSESTHERGLTPFRSEFRFGAGDALPFMSSNAATLAVATLAWADLRELLDAGLAVAARTFTALRGNSEAFAAPVAAARPLPGAVAVAAVLRGLTSGAAAPARLQDPFGLRTLPQVGGALDDALGTLHDVVAVELGAAAENPLVAEGEVFHHGGFHAASAALALDTVRLALVPFAGLALARISALMEPELTGLAPFLAGGAPGSSGLMIAEYVGADALARLRTLATPTSTGAVSISRGLEEHASFAWQGALQARDAVGQLRTLLALELVAAERAQAAAAGEAPEDAPLAPQVEDAAARVGGLAAEAASHRA